MNDEFDIARSPLHPCRYVLGSRSSRRRELLELIVPAEQIEVLPPCNAEEAGFEDLHDLTAIESRLREIARTKCDDVWQQVQRRATGDASDDTVIIAADTAIVVHDAKGKQLVLGQPPNDDTWQAVVRQWFMEHYAGKTHLAFTALCVQAASGTRIEKIARSEVTVIADVAKHLDWYLATGEPHGKAGGYALQGAGSIFISHVTGSLSNVIGLPLEALLKVLDELAP